MEVLSAALPEETLPNARRELGDERCPRTERGKHPTVATDRKSCSVFLPAGASPVGGASAHASKRAEDFVPGFFIFVNCMRDVAADLWMM